VETNRTSPSLGSLLQALFAQDAESDGELLRRFLAQRDEAAFTLLVKRHGPMVLGVCNRILGNAADADDAFQAAFLVLVRKARSLASRSVVGDWLHGVARRTALKARAGAARRRTVEQTQARPEGMPQEARNDWLPRLDEEIARLPQKYRLPIVLCDLEGKTRQAAARQLSWPEGTVAGRLARGRVLLTKRLLRGALVSSGVIAHGVAHGALHFELVQLTAKAAVALAAGNARVSGAAFILAQGVLNTMFWNKVKIAVVVLITTVVFGSTSGIAYQRLLAEGRQIDQSAAKAEQPAIAQSPANPGDKAPKALAEDRQKKLEPEINKFGADISYAKTLPTAHGQKALAEVAKQQYDACLKDLLKKAKVDVDTERILEWCLRLMQAEIKLAEKKEQSIIAYQSYLSRTTFIEEITRSRYEAGSIYLTSYLPAVYARIEAEIWLEEAKAAK